MIKFFINFFNFIKKMQNFEINMELNNENSISYPLSNEDKILIDISSIDFISLGKNEETNLFIFVLCPDKKSELILKLKANEESKLINLNKKLTALKNSQILIYTNDKDISANFKIIGNFTEIKTEIIKENKEKSLNDFIKIDKKESYNKLSGKKLLKNY